MSRYIYISIKYKSEEVYNFPLFSSSKLLNLQIGASKYEKTLMKSNTLFLER
jgi:hypothetical protein